ncbi:MAG TPA: G1 family glutamic endopeptidase [Gaiellaceae bacterium]
MRRLLLAAAAFAALVAAPGAFASTSDVLPQHSANWAGYAVSDATTLSTGTTDPSQTAPLQFTSVTATWKVPKVTCAADASPAYSAFWVGLGGYSDGAQALEQIGVDSDCTREAKPTYYAWYELVPAPSVHLTLQVQGGDTVTASVNVSGTDVLVQVKNRTRRSAFTRHLPMESPDLSSAEWIAEAPSACSSLGECHVLPLADFGSVGFTRIATIANTHGGTLTDPTWSAAALTLVPHKAGSPFFGVPGDAGKAGAAPAAFTADGRGFSVGWVADASALR